jgi:putative nucleotidyltransferase with HDIG domain
VGTFNIKEFIFSNRLRQITIYLCTFLIIYFVLITALVTKKYDIKEGEIAKVSIKAQRNTTDNVATLAKKEEALRLVADEYEVKPSVKDNALRTIDNLFSKALVLKEDPQELENKIKELEKAANAQNVQLSSDELKDLIELDKPVLTDLQKFLKTTMTEVYSLSIQFNENLSPEINNENLKKAQDMIQIKFNTTKFSKPVRELGTTIGVKLVQYNSFYDKEKTEAAKSTAYNSVASVDIKKDQIIVMEGQQVTKEKYELLKSLGLLNNTSATDKYIYISLGAFIALILFIQSFYLYKYAKEIYKDFSKVLLINIICIISLVLSRTLGTVSPFLVPLAFAPMLMTVLLSHKISLAISVLNIVFLSASVNFNIDITIMAILNAGVGALMLQKLQARNDIFISCIYLGIINLVATFSLGFLLSNNVKDVMVAGVLSLVGSSLSGILTVGLLPLFESTFDIVTTIKLLELSNPNSPLLKKLLMEAPGTYHHSVLVANLAEVGAEAVGGNPVLARVSSYYHDIGKIKRPYFFKENQIGSDNPHDKITPNLSSLIITSHVKDGLELAKEYRMPKVIRDVIVEHHGNSLVKYFYVTAKNSSEKPEEILEEDFRYPGPIPSTKESGIVMLADSVEASVRSISEPTPEKIEAMLDNMFKSRLNENMLDNCDLTLKDLTSIKKAFMKTLLGIYHQRIEYPVDKWQLNGKSIEQAKL